MAGIVSPRSFADLELSYYEPLGVKKPEDRKKLFFLVQKVKGVLEGDESEGSELLGGSSGGEPEDGGESSLSGSLASVGDDQENCNYRENATTNNNAKAGSGRGVPRLAGLANKSNNNSSCPHPSSARSNIKRVDTEVGMSVETSPHNMEPISPVTLASPLSGENGYEVMLKSKNANRGGTSSSYAGKKTATASSLLGAKGTAASSSSSSRNAANAFRKESAREALERELQQRRALKRQQEEEKAAARNKYTTSAYSMDESTTTTYQNDFDELDECLGGSSGSIYSANSKCKPRAPVTAGGSVGTTASRSRRSSMLPRLKPHHQQHTSTTPSFDDELDECLDGRMITTPKTISTSLDRKSMHSRPTVRKTNISTTGAPMRGSTTVQPLVMENDDDHSMISDTSDLSNSINSFSSVGSSISSRRRSARQSTGTYSSTRSAVGNRLEDKSSVTSRVGTKRLSTIPSTKIAPVSPLAGLSSSQLEESIASSKPSATAAKKPSLAARRKSLSLVANRPGTTESLDSRRTAASRSEKVDLNSSFGSTSTTRSIKSAASKMRSVGCIGSSSTSRPNTSTSIRRRTTRSPVSGFRSQSKSPTPVSRGRTTPRSPTHGVRSQSKSPTPTSRGATPRSNRSVSPMRRTHNKSAVSPYRNGGARATSPARSVTRAMTPKAVRSPTNSDSVFVHGQPEDKSWGTQIAALRDNFNQDHFEAMHGKEAYLEDEEYEMRIRVIVRKRPMSTNEAAESCDVDVIHPLDYDDHGKILVYQPKTKLDLAKEVETTSFAFDNVFNEDSNNLEIYSRSVQNLIPGVFHGKWATVFGYGQTGSGKTFTMMGSNMTGQRAGNQAENNSEANLGLYFLAAQDVFRIAELPEYNDITISVSLFEIYGGKLIDLLNGRNPVKCLEDSKGKVCFPGLTGHAVHDAEELMDIIEQGSLNRSVGTTSANADSSRSHAVLQLCLRKDVGKVKDKEHGECYDVLSRADCIVVMSSTTHIISFHSFLIGRLTFIDLAGSERGADTSKASKTTRMEGAEINTSLLALKEVIRALATGSSMKRIPFRGSKLTQVLKESFVGKNSRTVMVSCVAPNMKNVDHTLNTLRYADRVKERDAVTGQLSAAVAANSNIKRDRKDICEVELPARPLTAPAKSFRIDPEHNESSDDETIPPPPAHEENYQDESSLAKETRPRLSEKFAIDEYKSVEYDGVDDDSIYQALNSRERAPAVQSSIPRQPTPTKVSPAAQSLIATHKSIMSQMLSMVKV